MINFGFWVSLRRLYTEDIAIYREIRNSYAFRMGSRQCDLKTSEDVQKLLADKDSSIFEINHRGSQKGICALSDINHVHQRAEFSIFIQDHVRRLGVAEMALKTLFCHGFRNLNLNVIHGETFDNNNAAHRLFDKVGMVRRPGIEQAYYKDGVWVDSHIIFMTKKMFLERDYCHNEQR